jgi:hypothetical protein
MHILLVEPNYYTRFPPLGLLKISAYYKKLGDTVELIRVKHSGLMKAKKTPDLIYVTSLWTWAWKPVWDAVGFYKKLYPKAEVWLGGIYASLLPEHAAQSGADKVHIGLFEEAEDLLPDYTLVPEWDGSIIFASRGCNRRCGFCVVWKLEGTINSCKRSIKHLIWPTHSRIIFWDNNILQSPYWKDIFSELEELKLKVDFNQGLDAAYITDETAEMLARIRLDSGRGVKIRLAYDEAWRAHFVEKAIERLKAVGIRGREIMVYTLFNWTDDPDDFYKRVLDVLEWGAVAYPMRYEPPTALKKNAYISPRWTAQKLELVQRFRRVVGYAGALPPYKALIEKFEKAKCFDEAFSLRPPRGGSGAMRDLRL